MSRPNKLTGKERASYEDSVMSLLCCHGWDAFSHWRAPLCSPGDQIRWHIFLLGVSLLLKVSAGFLLYADTILNRNAMWIKFNRREVAGRAQCKVICFTCWVSRLVPVGLWFGFGIYKRNIAAIAVFFLFFAAVKMLCLHLTAQVEKALWPHELIAWSDLLQKWADEDGERSVCHLVWRSGSVGGLSAWPSLLNV